MRLRNKELNQIIKIGSLAQECASDVDFAQIMSEEVLKLFKSRSSVFIECVTDTFSAHMNKASSYQINPVHSEDYMQYYHKLDPCFNHFSRIYNKTAIPCVSTNQVINNEVSYINSEYYQKFMRSTGAHHSIIFGIKNNEKSFGLVGLHREKNQQQYTEEDHLKVSLIAPYLSTALMYREKIEHIKSQRSIINRFLKSSNIQAYLLLDNKYNCLDFDGDLHFLPNAKNLFVKTINNKNVSDFLPYKITNYIRKVGASATLQNQDEHIINDLDNMPKIRLEFFKNAEKKLFILVIFLQNQTNIVSKNRMEYFSLTQRQIEIVRLVELGYTNMDIAQTLGISNKTVENHLTQIYAKTSSHNKTSLILQLSDCH